ncbi:excinuclease ABC subunit C [Steroidobacter denitrificans]|uniref:UvrABC system protein C n=1 Tax=Steroidobacter denitrificans TaxID=465721 RepID=A0A127F9E5_STEDE|nr:excinuclease ABC subunit UvrC [Steroidobacter denitrificans]AMN47046.1 excinuclease ABC subunit C [Steroidobacter denitrificans]
MTTFDAKRFLANVSRRPGVYRMIGANGELLYVGKASNLKNRLSSYFVGKAQSAKTMAMIAQVVNVEVTATASETEALLLEYNLIKQHRPRYNVTLRDDKSFPYLYITTQHDYPRISFHRGSRKLPGRFFGPYPNARATRETLLLLQKLFLLRPCSDSFFANRSRPCLQYQIKRCSAPCVEFISKPAYAQDVADAIKVLEGRGTDLIDELAKRMEQAAAALDFERAARIRDQINGIKAIHATQSVTRSVRADIDAVALASQGNDHCVSIVFVRGGRNLGSSNFFPRGGIAEAGELLAEFLAQYYLGCEAPAEILVEQRIEGAGLLAAALSERMQRTVRIRASVRGVRARWLEMARTNAGIGLKLRRATEATAVQQSQALAEALMLPEIPARIECFDVSHTLGERTVASCVVFGPEGPIKSDYRRFNIEGLTPGDDYSAMRQALGRRYARLKKGEAPMPDLLLIDGGPGQLAEAVKVMAALDIQGVTMVGVSKGADRRAGQERLFRPGHEPAMILPPDSPALHLIQRVRDEAHRFAITGHRQRRAKARTRSVLENVPGLGPHKRRELLRQFGGLQGISRAGIDDLARVRGIGRRLAQSIYDTLHSSG